MTAKQEVNSDSISILIVRFIACYYPLVSHASCIMLKKSIHVGTVYTGKAAY